MSRRVLPKRLEEDLKNIPKYKQPDKLQEKAQKAIDDSVTDNFSVEKRMFDDLMGPISRRSPSFNHQLQPKRESSEQKIENSSDDLRISSNFSSDVNRDNIDFTTTILSRLTTTEGELKAIRQQLAEKIRHIDKLEQENSAMKIIVHDKKMNESSDQIIQLRRENTALSQQLIEMEQFLADYGLVWVGFNSKSTNSNNITPTKPKIENEMEDQHTISFSQFNKKIEELNDIIRSEPTQIKTEARRARLVHAEEQVECIRVIYYSNGLMVKRGPFRPINSNSYHTFVRDILDGFFPSEFRNEYPDGVILDLKDKHSEPYIEGNNDDVMTQNQLLSRLPKIAIRNGEVVHVRDELETKIRNMPTYNDIQLQPTHDNKSNGQSNNPVTDANVNRSIIHVDSIYKNTDNDSSSISTSISLATVQVRWIQGSLVLVVRVPTTGTVGDIHTEIRRHFNDGCPPFELRSAYPPRSLCEAMTLEEAALLPNGTVHAKQLGV
eukprot:gene4926-9825_t